MFTQKCSQCHKLSRPINSDYALPDEWSRYIKRMMNKPGSGISTAEGKKIYEFLVYDSSVRKKAMVDEKLAKATPADKAAAEAKIKEVHDKYDHEVIRSDRTIYWNAYNLSSRTAGRELFHPAGPLPRGLSGPHGLRRLRAGHRRGALRGRLHHRPHAESVRLHLRPRLRRAVRGEMPARGARRLGLHPRVETVRL